MDSLINEAFIQCKSRQLTETIRQGILMNGYDWQNAPLIATQTASVQGYASETLLLLVLIHSEIYSTIPDSRLAERLLGSLVHSIFLCLLSSFREIDFFSLGAALQACLDISALMNVLGGYLDRSEDVNAIAKLCIQHVESCSEESITSEHWELIQRLVGMWRKASQLEFLVLEN